MKTTRWLVFLMMVLACVVQSGMVFAGIGEVELEESFNLPNLFVVGVILMVVLAIIIAIALFLRNYIKVPSNKVAIVVGRKRKLPDGSVSGFSVIKGGTFFRWPVAEEVFYLDLNVLTLDVETRGAVTLEGVPVDVQAVANVRVGGDDASVTNAAEALLGKDDQSIRDTVKRTLEAHLRTICGTLTVEAINADRAAFSQKVTSESETELGKFGVVVMGLTVQHIADQQGYIQALGVKRTAEVKRDAAVGTAEATRDSDIRTAQAESEAQMKSTDAQREGAVQANKNQEEVAQAERNLRVKQAELAAEVAAKEAARDQAGPKAKATAEKDVFIAEVDAQRAKAEAEMALQKKLAERKEQELVVTQIKPAEAAQKKAVIDAEAAKQAAIINAEAAQRQLVIAADAAKQAAVVEAEGYKAATVMRAEADRDAAIAKAEGDMTKEKKEGEGEAAKKLAVLKAEAEGESAKIQQAGLAEAAAIEAKLLAEAKGTLEKAKAFKALEDSAKLMFILERAPDVIRAIGDAGEKMLTPSFQAMGQGLANIDKLTIVETGGGSGDGKTGLERFAGTAPTMLFSLLQNARGLGFDVSALMKKLGVSVVENVGMEDPRALPQAPEKKDEPAALKS